MKRALYQVQSKALLNTESKTSKSSSGSKGGGSSKSFSGDTYGGYVVLVRHQGKILAKYSNENKFTTDEWLAKLAAPIQKDSTRKVSAGGKKKKGNRKNKKKKKK